MTGQRPSDFCGIALKVLASLPPAPICSQPHHFARRCTWPATRSDSTARPQSLLHSTTAPRAVRAGCDPLAHAASDGRCHVTRHHATRTHTELHARQAQSFCPPILQQSYEGITTQVRVWRDRHNRMRGCRRHGIGTTDTRDEDGRAAQSERGGNAGKQRDFECAVRSSRPARPVPKRTLQTPAGKTAHCKYSWTQMTQICADFSIRSACIREICVPFPVKPGRA